MDDYDQKTEQELKKLLEKKDKEIQRLKKRKLGLYWDDEKEPEQVVVGCEKNIPVLQRIKEKEIKSETGEENILIEGDNFHALTCLNYTHKEKIDVIYIDPPYNTGNKDFKYNDKFVDREDGYKHSKWLNFIEKRLWLAKNLLKRDGVIFISIDDNEQAHLKLLCDKIFGDENFKGNIIWEKKYSAANDSKKISTTHDYILTFSRSHNWTMGLFERSVKMDNRYKNTDNDPRGPWKAGGLSAKTYTKSYDYQVKTPAGSTVSPPSGKSWSISEDKLKELLDDNRIYFGKNNDSKPQIKQFLPEVQQGSVPKSIWFKEDAGHNQVATQELERIFGFKNFDNPKPVKLLKRLLKVSNKKNGTILDFFAGSGTTGHAALELNREDGGNRKFILCTNNENKICEEVTYPRIEKAINGYDFNGKDKTELYSREINRFTDIKDILNNADDVLQEIKKIEKENKDKYDNIRKEFKGGVLKIFGEKNIKDKKGGLGGNLHYFKTDLIPSNLDLEDKKKKQTVADISDKKREELTSKAGQMIAIKESAFEEQETNDYYQLFESKDGKKRVGIYFRADKEKFEKLINKLTKHQSILYIFSYNKVIKKDYEVGRNIRIEDIPEPILEIYKEVNLMVGK